MDEKELNDNYYHADDLPAPVDHEDLREYLNGLDDAVLEINGERYYKKEDADTYINR